MFCFYIFISGTCFEAVTVVDRKSPLCWKQTDVFSMVNGKHRKFPKCCRPLRHEQEQFTSLCYQCCWCSVSVSCAGNSVSDRHHCSACRNLTFKKFPGVTGCVDGTYIPMIGKSGPQRDSYFCRKGFPALHAQIVCDNSLKILDITTGHPGSVHDARVFRNSGVYRHLQNVPTGFHLLGDSAYPLERFTMTPLQR